MDNLLTENVVSLLMHGAVDLCPPVEVLALKRVSSLNSAIARFRISIYDGIHKHETLLPTSYNHVVESHQLQEGSIIKMSKCTCNTIHNTTTIALATFEVVTLEVSIIGEPSPFNFTPNFTSHSSSSIPENITLNPQNPSLALPSSSNPTPTLVSTTVQFTSLNPSNKIWTIQGRVTSKTNMNTYTNQKGPGQLFGFDLVSATKDEIHISAFNDLATSLYDTIQVGVVYTISNETVKPVNPTYNHLKSAFEIFLNPSSTIQPCLEECPLIPFHCFHFKSIHGIQTTPLNSMVDLIGIVISVSPASTLRKRDGSKTIRRTIGVRDMSGISIDITLWGEHCTIEGAHLFNLQGLATPPILAIKGGCLTKFNGKTIGIISNTNLLIKPDIEEAKLLQLWFDDNGFHSTSPSLSKKYNYSAYNSSKRISISALQSLQHSEKETWYSVVATITHINIDDFHFLACPLFVDGIQCMKKISHKVGNTWHCEKCDGDFTKCDYRYILKIDLKNATGQLYGIIAFDDAAKQLMGVSAKVLCLLANDPTSLMEIVQRVCAREYLLTLSVKTETFNSNLHLKVLVVMSEEVSPSLETIDPLDESDNIVLNKRPIVHKL